MQRELWETVSELIEGLALPQAAALGLHVTGMHVELPVELVVVRTAVGFRLLLDGPHFRWDPGIRPQAGRLCLAVARAEGELQELTGTPALRTRGPTDGTS